MITHVGTIGNNMLQAKKSIKELLKVSSKIRYSDIEHIEFHHEALKELEDEKYVSVYFVGYKVFIEKI